MINPRASAPRRARVYPRVSECGRLGGAHHVPDPQDDGSCADMAAQTAARRVPAVPRGDHHRSFPAHRGRVGIYRRRFTAAAAPAELRSSGPKNDKLDLAAASVKLASSS